MGDRPRYEYKTVKALRGTDRMLIAKWEKRGWELSDQAPGTVRTDLTFRRCKPRVTRQAAAIGALAFLCAGAIVIGALTEGHDRGDNASNPRASSSSTGTGTGTGTGTETINIDDFLAALKRGDLQDYVQGHNADPMTFEARVTGVGPDTLKSGGFLNLRAVIHGSAEGPLLKLVWGGFSRIPFPGNLRGGEYVHVRANVDRYFSDEEVWLSPDDEDSFIRVRSSK